eukprot:CCRYP_013986-RB/>CCRYP_013986-RB protein AED:0.03 eAED:0.03 QI:158/1/1/1/1/0.8/5/1739/623
MIADTYSDNRDSTATPPPEEQPAEDVDSSDEILPHVATTSSTPQAATTASAPLSPCLSDLYLVSPPPRTTHNASNTICRGSHTPSIRSSLTPPPHSEKIHRAIRTAASQLDAAVDEVQRYIFQGCPDSDVEGDARRTGGTPGSEYSDDFMSPQVLPDFTKIPMRRASGDSFEVSKMSYRRRILEEEEEDSEEEQNESDCPETFQDEETCDLDEGMSKLQIHPCSGSAEGHLEQNEDSAVPALEEKDASDVESDEESVMPVTAKPRTRRVIDDDESSDESDSGNYFASDDDYSYVNDSDVEDDRSEKKKVMNSEVVLGDAFSELILEDTVEKKGVGTDDTNVSLDDISSTNNDLNEKEINDESCTIDDNKDDDDDESITIFEGCGCWTLDQSTNDLYLPSSSGTSGKWPRIRLPFSTYQKLYQHQRIGIQWIASLHRDTIKGGILADDMGMGKTMQTLVYLGSMMRAESIHNALIVCPKSVVRTWEREANLVFKEIIPKCKVCAITSDVGKEKRIREFTDAFCSSFKQPRLVVTTYGLISSHIAELSNIANNFPEWHWCYVVLDEGHCIKNPSTRISKHVRILCRNKKTRRLLLTGTPIQNNLRELHSLFDWATSGQLLGSLRT